MCQRRHCTRHPQDSLEGRPEEFGEYSENSPGFKHLQDQFCILITFNLPFYYIFSYPVIRYEPLESTRVSRTRRPFRLSPVMMN